MPLKALTVVRPSSPNSPVGAESFESTEGSEGEDDNMLTNEGIYDDEIEDGDPKKSMVVDGEVNGGSELVSSSSFVWFLEVWVGPRCLWFQVTYLIVEDVVQRLIRPECFCIHVFDSGLPVMYILSIELMPCQYKFQKCNFLPGYVALILLNHLSGSTQVDGLVRPQSPSAEKPVASMVRSHSIGGEIHGIHAPDPVAADILRKEPEQETFVRLNVTPIGMCVIFSHFLTFLQSFHPSCAPTLYTPIHTCTQ